MTSTSPNAAVGVDVLEAVFKGRLLGLGASLQNVEAIGVPPLQDARHNNHWRAALPTSNRRDAQNVWVRAANLIAIKIAGDQFSAGTTTPAFETLDPVANTLRIIAGDDVYFAFTYKPSDIVLKLASITHGPLMGAQLTTDGIPVSGILKARSTAVKAIELSGAVRGLQDDDGDPVAVMLKQAWMLRSIW